MPASDQGVQLNRYQLIPRTLIFVTKDDRVLLIKGSPQKRIWANRYNGLGGHVEQYEGIVSSAKRELYEESGLLVNDLWLVGLITIDTGNNPGVIVSVFRGIISDENQMEMPVISSSPEGELEWVRIDQLSNLPLVEDLPAILPKALSMTSGSEPFIARYSYDIQGKLMIDFSA